MEYDDLDKEYAIKSKYIKKDFNNDIINDAGYVTYRTAEEINDAMIRVYNYMALAVVNSMLVSYLISSSPALMAFLFTGVMKWVVLLAPIAAIFAIGYFIDKESGYAAHEDVAVTQVNNMNEDAVLFSYDNDLNIKDISKDISCRNLSYSAHEYLTENGSCEPLAYTNAIKNIKNLLFNIK